MGQTRPQRAVDNRMQSSKSERLYAFMGRENVSLTDIKQILNLEDK